jgi:cobalt-zinc-cadmium efflux system outer membrane protein
VLRKLWTLILLMMTPHLAFAQNSASFSPTQFSAPIEPPVTANDPESLPTPARLNDLPQEEWSLADLEELAFQRNPTLAIAAARIQAAQGQYRQKGLYPNPTIGYHATEIGNEGSAGQQGAFVRQRFMTAGKRGLDQEIASRATEEAHQSFLAQQQRVLSDVRRCFYVVCIAQKRVEECGKLAAISNEIVASTGNLIRARQAAENDLLQAEIQAQETQILIENARNEYHGAWRQLAAVVGIPSMKMHHLVGDLDEDLPIYDWTTCCNMVLEDNPVLEAARTRQERARISICRANRELIPNIDVAVSYRHHNVTQDRVANLEIGIPSPIFDRNQGNIVSAEAEWIAACNEVERLKLSLQDQLANVFLRYQNGLHQVGRYRQHILPRARRSLEITQLGYEKGQAAYLALLNAQQTLIRADLAYLDSLQQLRVAISLIENQLLTNNLSTRQ